MLNSILYKTFSIGKFKGIEFKIHWSFIVLILLCCYLLLDENLNKGASLHFVILFVVLFLSVIFHELGHALTAKFLNIKPKDVIISGLGGLARIESLKDNPRKEILIAVAGPLINLTIFIFCLLYVIAFTDDSFQISHIDTLLYTNYFSIVYKIGIINLILFTLNLIPAFPMDGGRILRALLVGFFGNQKATKLASILGRLIALAFFIFGAIFRYYSLIIISSLVYIMAAREAYIDLDHELQNQ